MDAAAQAARNELRAQADKTAIDSEFARIKKERRESTALAQRFFDEIVAHDRTECVPLDSEDVARALALSVAGAKPSKGKTARQRADIAEGEPGYAIEPDCLIIANVSRLLRDRAAGPSDVLLVCSDNLKDFGTWDQATNERHLASSI
ncbi:MAG: hypothetical protein Q8K89_04920, partial [Actinomycetota bacterium]|nr:hypothetical protein [Actinomycetota bacterium]